MSSTQTTPIVPPLVLFTLGLPFGDWEPLAADLLGPAGPDSDLQSTAVRRWLDDTIGPQTEDAATAAGGAAAPGAVAPLDAPATPRWGGLDGRLAWALDGLAQQWPQARYLVFVDGPAHALANWLDRHDSGPHEQALKLWEDAAQRILRHAHRHPSQVLLVDAAEARRHPDRLRAVCSRWLALDLPAGAVRSDAPASGPPDVCLAFGELAARTQPRLASLQAELLASSTPLSDEPGDAALGGMAVQAAAVAAQVRQDRQSRADLRARLDAAVAEGSRQAAALEAQAREATTNRHENDLLLRQLHEVQEQLESVFLARQDSEARLEQAAAAAQEQARHLNQLQNRLDQALAERDAQARAVAERTAAHQSAEDQLKKAGDELEQARQSAAALRQEVAQRDAALAALQQRMDEACAQRDREARTAIDALETELRRSHEQWSAQVQGHVQELAAARNDLSTVSRDLVDMVAQRESDAAQFERLQQELEAAAALRATLEQALTEREWEIRRLGEAMDEAAEQAEARLVMAAAQAEARLAEAQEQARQLRLERDEHQAFATARQVQIDQGQAQVQRIREQLETAAQVQSRLTGQLAAARHDAENLRQENALVLGQMRRMQETLAQQAEAKAAPADTPAPRIEVGTVAVGALRDTPPHRELGLALQQVRIDDRQLDEIAIRLVEHHGHPGLVVFGDEPACGLAAWCETGREDDRPYMLLVPVDEAGRAALQRMGTRDWLFVNEAVAAIERSLTAAAGDDQRRWRTVASRLRLQLAALPARLRYDDAHVLPAGERPDSGEFSVRFDAAVFGSHPLPSLQLIWRPEVDGTAAGAPPVEIVHDRSTGGDPPLSEWPLDDGGEWAERCPLPLGSGIDDATRRARWAAMPEADRALVLALLDALPGAARRVPTTHPLAQDAAALEADAARWLPQALQALAPVAAPERRRGGLLRALLRRPADPA